MSWHGRFGSIPRPDRWLFIVGCYNSGTTLLHRMIGMHPDVGTLPGEGQFFTDVLPLPRDHGLPRLWALHPEMFRLTEDSQGVDSTRLKRQWGARFNHANRPVLAEKSPTNAARTLWLQRHFDGAHFIGLVRNGYAVAEGIRRREGHDIKTAARQWRVCNEIMLEDFRKLYRARVVRYEELAVDPDAQLAAILQFAGLSPEIPSTGDLSLRIHDRFSTIHDMNDSSIAALSASDRAAIRAEAGALLNALGYEPSGSVP